jgi:hypothetical protein
VSNVEPASDKGGGSFKVRLEGPANLWGQAVLASRQTIVSDDYTAFASAAFLMASGFKDSTCSSRYTDTYVEETWKVA